MYVYMLQQNEDTFKQRTLASLSSNLISAKQHLYTVTKQQTVCLDEFLKSHTLVTWVKNNLKSEHKLLSIFYYMPIKLPKPLYYICTLHSPTIDMSDVKVFVELASISAGENDTEIDQVACFHDAVMGYGPLLYTLSPSAGFAEFMTCARLVWEAQHRDDKLPDKLVRIFLFLRMQC